MIAWPIIHSSEHWLMKITVVASVIFLICVIWIHHVIKVKKHSLIDKKATYVWMKTVHAAHIQPQKTVNESQLLAVMAEELEHVSFKQFPLHMQQAGAHLIQLSFDKVPYSDVMVWLWKLTHNYQVNIQ